MFPACPTTHARLPFVAGGQPYCSSEHAAPRVRQRRDPHDRSAGSRFATRRVQNQVIPNGGVTAQGHALLVDENVLLCRALTADARPSLDLSCNVHLPKTLGRQVIDALGPTAADRAAETSCGVFQLPPPSTHCCIASACHLIVCGAGLPTSAWT